MAPIKATILTFLLCLVLHSSAKESKDPKRLSMMNKAVDDEYSNCSKTMAEKVKSGYFPNETNINDLFRKAWKLAESFAQKKFRERKNKALTKEEIQAIYVYTLGYPNVYEPFNALVRDGADKYTTKAFPYHALHYWLTSAIKVLNVKKPCRITYRRTKIEFEGDVGHEMRFGSFASTSKVPNLTTFGTKTCFRIKTCFGAYIKNYSKLSNETEVLIPPYEKFKIVKKAAGSYQDLQDCEKIFVLESANKLSNLDCKAANVK